MFSHYLRHALRLIGKQRLHSALNVVGLAAAFGVCTLIALFVRDEYSYDAWHENADRIYRLDGVDFNADGSVEDQGPWQPYPFGEAVARDLPGLEQVVRLSEEDVVLRLGDSMSEVAVLFADASVFDVFTYRVLEGDLASALADPGSVVLTKSVADRLFGDTAAVGQDLEARFEETYLTARVTAVVQDPPSNTHLPFEALMPFHRLPMVYDWVAGRVDRWNASSFTVFGMLSESADPVAAKETLKGLWQTYYPDMAAQGREAGWWGGEGNPASYDMVPLRELHLRADIQGGFVATSSPVYALILAGIGLLILIIACINFTLLSVGRSAGRASEIGVRKALGARRWEIMTQFGGEAIVLSLAGLVGGLIMAEALLPAANSLAGKDMAIRLFTSPVLGFGLLALALLTGILAGWYPSVVISRHRPSESLRGRFQMSGSSVLTKTLLVTQFAASIALVAGALVMQSQLEYLQTRDVGYDASNVIVVHGNGTDGEALTRKLVDALGTRSDVLGMSPISLSLNRGGSRVGWTENGVDRTVYEYVVGPDLIDVLRMDLVSGRGFDISRSTDSSAAVIVNEAFLRDWELTPATALGTVVEGYHGGPEIIGVIEDFNFRSQHETVSPMVFSMSGSRMNYVLVRATAGTTSQLLAAIDQAWAVIVPGVPFKYSFLDDDVAMAYESDLRWSMLIRLSAGLAILVACLGLFGLAALTVSRRTKEIGIRKVLGATVRDVTVLVSGDFAKLVAAATVLSSPLAYLGLQRWLDGFAYRISLTPWVFLAAGGMVLVIAMLTVLYHSLKAATADPVRSLRYE
jgi:putative ABC transport system permease protein